MQDFRFLRQTSEQRGGQSYDDHVYCRPPKSGITLTFKLNISSQSYQHAHMLAVTEFQNIKNPSKSTHLQCFQLE